MGLGLGVYGLGFRAWGFKAYGSGLDFGLGGSGGGDFPPDLASPWMPNPNTPCAHVVYTFTLKYLYGDPFGA